LDKIKNRDENPPSEAWSKGSADLRTDETKCNPDSEQIEYTVAKPHIRNSVSMERIQDKSRLPLFEWSLDKIKNRDENPPSGAWSVVRA